MAKAKARSGQSPLTEEQLRLTVEAYHNADMNQEAAARRLGISQQTVSDRLVRARKLGMIGVGGSPEAMRATNLPLPEAGKVKRYLLTCAQTNTKLYAPFWANLRAMAKHYRAEIMVSTFNYDTDALGQQKLSKLAGPSTKYTGNRPDPEAQSWLPPELAKFICNDRIDVAPNLTFCGELQISPTARRPLSGMENYTHRKSSVIPHTTIAMKSVAGMKGEGVKLMFTTGCVTQRHYIKRKEGFRAEHFHTYGALLVEVNDKGQWWCRQVEQGEDETLRDLTLVFQDGMLIEKGARVEAITWGDIHASKIDPECAAASWGGKGSMLDTLRPRHQYLHDLLDFSRRSHHTRRDPFKVFEAYVHDNRASMGDEFMTTAKVAADIYREWCRTVVVDANHDRHFPRALAEIDWRDDMENAELILKFTAEVLAAIRTKDKRFHLLRSALLATGVKGIDKLVFLQEDASDVVLREWHGGIECALHGDRGANGAKGTPAGIAKIARAINMADKHTAEIIDLVYVAGLSAQLDLGYNKGLSSWTQSHIITYPNGCRTIVGIWAGKFRA